LDWRRDVYEGVMRLTWRLLLDGMEPVADVDAYRAPEVLARIPIAVDALIARTPQATQEAFLDAMERRLSEAVGPIEPACQCRYCRTARGWLSRRGQFPRSERLARLVRAE